MSSAWRKSSHSGGNTGGCVEVATAWRKSSYSGGDTGGCVEVATAGAVLIRDTTDRGGPMVSVPAAAWRSFLSGIRAS
jgi:hypothetical protein